MLEVASAEQASGRAVCVRECTYAWVPTKNSVSGVGEVERETGEDELVKGAREARPRCLNASCKKVRVSLQPIVKLIGTPW